MTIKLEFIVEHWNRVPAGKGHHRIKLFRRLDGITNFLIHVLSGATIRLIYNECIYS